MTSLSIVLILATFQAAAPESQREAPTTYTLGPDDQIVIRAVEVQEIDNKPIRIDAMGNINLPMIGRIQAAGLTTEQLETVIETRLKKYLNEPDVSVALVELRSQPVSVLGSVQTPGVHQLQGPKTLFEILSLAGGLRPDAGNKVTITRRMAWGPVPLPTAATDATGQFSVASLSVKSIMSATNPAENIRIKPNDVISVPKGDIVYVIGGVRKSGGFVIGENESLSALQVLALAEGLDRAAAPKRAKIMRNVLGSSVRTEIAVDLKKILEGKGTDVSLRADDILFVPTSATKNVAMRALEAAVQIGTGVAIYR